MDDQYIISDASRLLDVEPHVLRYWEEELALNIARNQLGHRYYSETDLNMLRKVKALKEQGLQLRAIKVLLSNVNFSGEIKLEKTNLQPIVNNALEPQGENKLKQFQGFIKDVFETSLKENNEIIKAEIKSELSSNMRVMMQRQEEIEEKRFRRLDETIREMQKARQEVAVTKGWRLDKEKWRLDKKKR